MLDFRSSPEGSGVIRLSTEILLPESRAAVFEYFADAGNLESITPPWLNFRIETPLPIDMREGTLIDYRLRLRGFSVSWRTEISVWAPPVCFVDRQIRGPYRLWEHTHTFRQTADGTLVRDRIDYIVPGGSIVDRLFVRPELRRIFAYRHDRLAGTFSAAQPESKSHQAQSER